MKTILVKELETKLSIWRAERHLDCEKQKKGLLPNILEELTEYTRSKSDYERIDALCDICVFLFNASEKPKQKSSFSEKQLKDLDIDLNFVKYVITSFESRDYCIDLCFYMMERLGFDSYKCMLETLKEISSRTGYFDETINKFVKDRSPEATAKWYEADYSKCRL